MTSPPAVSAQNSWAHCLAVCAVQIQRELADLALGAL